MKGRTSVQAGFEKNLTAFLQMDFLVELLRNPTHNISNAM
jgi:hypothetical protein